MSLELRGSLSTWTAENRRTVGVGSDLRRSLRLTPLQSLRQKRCSRPRIVSAAFSRTLSRRWIFFFLTSPRMGHRTAGSQLIQVPPTGSRASRRISSSSRLRTIGVVAAQPPPSGSPRKIFASAPTGLGAADQPVVGPPPRALIYWDVAGGESSAGFLIGDRWHPPVFIHAAGDAVTEGGEGLDAGVPQQQPLSGGLRRLSSRRGRAKALGAPQSEVPAQPASGRKASSSVLIPHQGGGVTEPGVAGGRAGSTADPTGVCGTIFGERRRRP
ncbi:uncharacterized protein LOC122167155 isoform X2 [Centrocercus urophasianus]|uniref:uncharacterized protein LOC122167155 isoform X2 n=1 Tax=Centrocercus urophasianus TaxID=9002 RepID=UPI001C64700C|nr:uncharacterized protein LOC122167155 isoform X2 [Centrocercus urophasianus]